MAVKSLKTFRVTGVQKAPGNSFLQSGQAESTDWANPPRCPILAGGSVHLGYFAFAFQSPLANSD